MSINVRGLANESKRRSIFEMTRKRADIICIQESHSTLKMEEIWKNEWGGKILFNHGESNALGVCILIKKGVAIDINEVRQGHKGRILVVNMHINEIPLYFSEYLRSEC